MMASTKSARAVPLETPEHTRSLLDALASGASSQERFVRRVQALARTDPDVTWEILSLLDQYFRCKKISQDTFKSIKASLEQFALGSGDATPAAEPALRAEPASRAEPPPRAEPAPPAESQPISWIVRIGDVLRDRYRVIGILGSGQSGTLVEALDEEQLDRPDRLRLAIRVLDTAELQRSGKLPGLLRQVCKLQTLEHPNIARVFDFDQHRSASILTMELVRGEPLVRFNQHNGVASLNAPAAMMIVRHVASALAYAHSQDVFHGDVRAENVFITQQGDIRLLGFDAAVVSGTATAEKDRLAFAWLAYDLLTNARTATEETDRIAPRTRLRRPQGISGEQWRVLRATLLGRKSTGRQDVFSVFILDGGAMRPHGSRHFAGWFFAVLAIAAGCFALVQYRSANSRLDEASEEPVTTESADLPVASARPATTVKRIARTDLATAATIAAQTAASEIAAPPAPTEQAPTRAHISLPSDSLQVNGSDTAARIVVRRKGRMSGAVSFLWWTETGSARADEDFGAVAPRMEHIADGAGSIELFVPLVSNPRRTDARTFYVKIDEASAGAVLDGQTLMQVSIVP